MKNLNIINMLTLSIFTYLSCLPIYSGEIVEDCGSLSVARERVRHLSDHHHRAGLTIKEPYTCRMAKSSFCGKIVGVILENSRIRVKHTLRLDFDPGKGYHINLCIEQNGTNIAKYALMFRDCDALSIVEVVHTNPFSDPDPSIIAARLFGICFGDIFNTSIRR